MDKPKKPISRFKIPLTRRQKFEKQLNALASAAPVLAQKRPLPHYGDWPAWLHIDWEPSPNGRSEQADITVPDEWTEEQTATALNDLIELHTRTGRGIFLGEPEVEGTVRVMRMLPVKDLEDAEIVSEELTPEAKERLVKAYAATVAVPTTGTTSSGPEVPTPASSVSPEVQSPPSTPSSDG